MHFSYHVYQVIFESNIELNLPESIISNKLAQIYGKVRVDRLGGIRILEGNLDDCTFGIRSGDGWFSFDIPGVVKFIVEIVGFNRVNVSCWGDADDLVFFFERVVCAEALKLLGLTRVLGCLCELDGQKLLFVGPSAAGKTAVAAAVLSCGGTVIADGFAIWENKNNELYFYAAGLTLLCWGDVKTAWFNNYQCVNARGNFRRFFVPIRKHSASLRGLSAIISIMVANESESGFKEVLGTAKLSRLSGYVDKPFEFHSVCSGLRVFDFHRPRVITSSFPKDLETQLRSIVSMPNSSHVC